jgi:hypothetical protein
MLPYPIVVSHLSFNFLCCYSVVFLSLEQKKSPMWLKNIVLTLIVILPSLAGGEWLSRHDLHWCQMAEFRAAGPKNGPVKFLAA